MPRLLHMADVHLGARHHDLGPAAVQQRERQFAAFARAVDSAISERVELVLIVGDLFDSNAQPRRSVERAVGELKRLVERGIPVVLIPGTHDCYEPGSIYRVFDLPAMAGVPGAADGLVVLTDGRPSVRFEGLDLTVHGWVSPAKQAPRSPLQGFATAAQQTSRWHIGMIHGSLFVPGVVEQDDVLFTQAEIASSGLHYLALGHWHSYRHGRAGSTPWAYPGAPEPVALDQDGAGHVLLVTLEDRDGGSLVNLQPVMVGRTRIKRLEIDASEIGSQDELVRGLRELADPDVVLDVRLAGLLPADLDLVEEEVEEQLSSAFLRFRLRNHAVPALPDGPPPPPETVVGAFVELLETRIAAAEAADAADVAAEQRQALRLGRLLLDDPSRVTLV